MSLLGQNKRMYVELLSMLKSALSSLRVSHVYTEILEAFCHHTIPPES